MLLKKKKFSRILFVSPHLDDVCFSCSMLIQRLKLTNEIFILNVFSRSNYSLTQEKTVEEVTRLRKLEDKEYCLKHSIVQLLLDFDDSSVRNEKNWFVDDTYSNPEIESQVLNEIINVINNYKIEKVYFPLGVGNHIDHLILFNVSRKIDVKIHYYEDLPYRANVLGENKLNQFYVRVQGMKKRSAYFTSYKIKEKEKDIAIYKSQINEEEKMQILNYNKGLIFIKETIWY